MNSNDSPASGGIMTNHHEHPLKYTASGLKKHPAYANGFTCNICRTTYGPQKENMYCCLCNFDLCDDCLNGTKKREYMIQSETSDDEDGMGGLFG